MASRGHGATGGGGGGGGGPVSEQLSAIIAKLDSALAAGELDTVSSVRASPKAAQEYHRLTQRTHSWQSAGKRGTHQPQVESLAMLMLDNGLVAPRLPIEGGSGGGVLIELGAGKALLGQVVSSLAGADLIVVDRRACDKSNYDVRVGGDLGGHGGGADNGGRAGPAVEATATSATTGVHGLEHARRVVADVTDVDLLAWAPVGRSADGGPRAVATVLAKHLCACGSDEALRRFVDAEHRRGDGPARFVSMVLAPCCHPQITWAGFSGKAHFSKLGFTESELPLMLQLLDLSKSPVLHESSAARWKAIKKLGVDGIKRCGWLVRRVIERCRCKWVEAETEFDATIVEYVSNDVTPDNLVAVFRPRAANGPLAEVSIAHSLVHTEYPRVPRRGVTLHVTTSEKDAPKVCARLVTYLLECCAGSTSDSHLASIRSSWVAMIRTPKGQNKAVVVVCGDPVQLVAGLTADRIVTAIVDRVMVFDRLAPNFAAFGVQVTEVSTISESSKARMFAWPPEHQAEALAQVPLNKMTIHGAAQTLSAVCWDSVGTGTAPVIWSALPVEVWRPALWGQPVPAPAPIPTPPTDAVDATAATPQQYGAPPTEADGAAPPTAATTSGRRAVVVGTLEAASSVMDETRRPTGSGADSSSPGGGGDQNPLLSGKCAAKKVLHLVECSSRLHLHKRVAGKRVLVLGVADGQVAAIERWAGQHGAASTMTLRPSNRGQGDEWQFTLRDGRPRPPPEQPSDCQGYEVIVVQGERGFKDDIAMLRAATLEGLLGPGCLVFGQVKLGHMGKRDKANASCTRAIRSAECFSDVKIHHMLNERETERTLIMTGLGTVQAGARSTQPGFIMH